MSQKHLSHSDVLAALLVKERKKKYLSACIRDLVTNGPVSARFFGESNIPGSQDVMQYLAAWFRHIGISPDVSQKWMQAYCSGVLSERSTKADIRDVLNSDILFDCGCEHNLFKAPCSRSCLIYDEMYEKYRVRKAREAFDAGSVTTPVKGKYSSQFEEARQLLLRLNDEGLSRNKIVPILNEQGFKTRTGRSWTYAIVSSELDALGRNIGSKPRKKYFRLKDKYKEQFGRAFDSALKLLKNGVPVKEIVGQLNAHGFKTRTGRPWTVSLLRIEFERNRLNKF